MLIDNYASILVNLIEQITSHERETILSAARIVAKCLMNDGLIRVFGCGHSHILAEETFYRAGGLVPVSPIFYEPLMLHESASESSTLEKAEGVAHKVLDTVNYGKNDVLICVSTSGVNAVPVEFAALTRDLGIAVIGISSDSYLDQKPKNTLGLHLQEVCDVCINNYAPHGDACLHLSGMDTNMIPVSTITSSFVINSILAEAVEFAAYENVKVPLYVSGNIPGGAERNKAFIEKYKPRIFSL